jgi:hypothetical protein
MRVPAELDHDADLVLAESANRIATPFLSGSDIAFVVKWTLKNAQHLTLDDAYLIKKAIDNCHLEVLRLRS